MLGASQGHLGVPVCPAAHPAPAALGWGKEPKESHPTAPGQTLLRILPAPGRGRKQIFREPNCTIPTRLKFKAFQQSHQEPLKKKILRAPSFPGQVRVLSLPIYSSGKFFLRSEPHPACCSCAQTGQPLHSKLPEQSSWHLAPPPPPRSKSPNWDRRTDSWPDSEPMTGS